MKAKLIINPKSGKIKKKMPPILRWTFKKLEKKLMGTFRAKTTAEEVIREVKKICYKEKIKLDIDLIKHQHHARELAKEARDKYDLVIVAGGDGTVNEVINALAGSKTTVVIIPFGSANVLALELGIPFSAREASALIVHGKKIRMDLGYAKTAQEARYFSTMLGVGFVPSLINRIDSKFKKRWGKLAYPLAGIRQLFRYTWYNIHVKHGIHSVGYFIVVSNSKDYGGEYRIADKASTTDGLLDLVVINRHNWWKITEILSSLFSGKLNKFLKGEYYQIKEAHIYSKHKLLVQVDGELIGTVPVNVQVVPKALSIMVKNNSSSI